MRYCYFLLFLTLPVFGYAQPPVEVNSKRLNQTLEELAGFGRNPDGAPNRVAFSDGDLKARVYVRELMDQAGLETRSMLPEILSAVGREKAPG